MSDCDTTAVRHAEADEVSKLDWGLLYGCGLFETVRVYDGIAVLLDEHIDRMAASAAQLGLDVPFDRREMARRASRFCSAFDDRVVRMTITRGNPDVGLPPRLLLSDRPALYTDADRTSGIAVQIASMRRNETSPIARHKTLNQLENILAWRAAQEGGYRESLFLNTAGHLAEGSRSNVFAIAGGEVFTPALSCGILPGITRGAVIAALRQAGVQVHECELSLADLLACDECFLTSAVMEIMPVSRIGIRRPRKPVPGPLTGLAAAAYGTVRRRGEERADRIAGDRRAQRPAPLDCRIGE